MEISKERIEAQICAYVDGELSGEERAEIERHLASNPQHRALIAELMQHKALLQELPRASVPGDLNEGLTGQLERHSLLGDDAEQPARARIFRIHRWPQFASIAAVIMLAVGLGIVVTYVLPSSRFQGVAIKQPRRAGQTPVATSAPELDALARGKETEMRLSKSAAGAEGVDGVVGEKMKQQVEENLVQVGPGLGRGLAEGQSQNQGEVRAKDAYSFGGYFNSGAPGATAPVGTVVGLQRTRQLLERGATLTANYGDAATTWAKGDQAGVERAVTPNAPADERSPRLAMPTVPSTDPAMMCLVVSTDSPATVNGHLGSYLREHNIRYAFTEVGGDGKLLAEQGVARGTDRLGAGAAAPATPLDVRARITVQDKAAKEAQGPVAGGVPLVGQAEVFKESETPSRGAVAGSEGARGRGGFGGGAGGTLAQGGRTGGATTPPAPAQRPATADMPAGGAAAGAVGQRRAADRADEYAKTGESIAGRETSERQGAADAVSRGYRREEENLAAKAEAGAVRPAPTTSAPQEAGKPVDATALNRSSSYGTQPAALEKKSAAGAATGAGADTRAAVPPVPSAAPANQPSPGQVAANAEADRDLDLAKRRDAAGKDGAAQGKSLSLAYDPQTDAVARGGEQPAQVEWQFRQQQAGQGAAGQPPAVSAPVPVPAGNGIIVARMSRRQLSELGMKLSVDPMAQKTEIHETAQVALDDVTFKVPLAVGQAAGAAAAAESRAIRDLAALGTVRLRAEQTDEAPSARSDRAKLNEPKGEAKAADAGTGVDAARPRPDAAQEPRSMARGRFRVPAAPATVQPANPAGKESVDTKK